MNRFLAMRSKALALDALVAVLIVGCLHYLVWAWTHQPEFFPDWEGKVRGFAYSGFQRDEDPTKGLFPTEAELASDMKLLARYTNRIRTYTAIENQAVPHLAAEQGIKVTAGAWLDRRKDNNERELAALKQMVRENRNIDRVIIGNESVLRGDIEVPELIAHIKRAKRELKVPVSTAEPWHVWLRYPELTKSVDFITVHLLPYWEGVPVDKAVDYAMVRLEELKLTYPKKRIVIGEIGWPSRGDRRDGAVASPEAQAQFVREFLDRTHERRLEYYFMEAFDQPWKVAHEGRAGPYWGLFDADRAPKFPLAGPVVSDPSWPKKAIAAALLAAPFMLWFAIRFRRFKPAGLLFFAGVIQAAAAVVVWLVTLPFEFYLSPLDWAMLLLLVPALLAMVSILLVNGFEFTEVAWRRRWLRHFKPVTLEADAPRPFVSIHLPCYNEPPEMVILTLDSLAKLDYENFEVLVIDNNTKDEAVWKPVEEHVAKLGAKFRFFHLDNWPGFKAGALNFALTETDPRAEVIGVVDADYAVEPDWLAKLVGHFEEASVAVVQAPQAHREFEGSFFKRMANWEFDGFFRVGMHHRHERNAIIQHGTMTLVRKSALAGTGGWSEWCICEDAELGLRLMHAGLEVRYVDHVFGRGLTPATFKAFKSQRTRWAFGAMQILKGRWDWLTRPGPLSAGQRYHFLTGWFSWFADALHLLFAGASIVWTIGLLAWPQYFSLPLDLFMIPVLGFFAAKVFFGPALYRLRVKCGWADVFGAALASMSLSHAIAHGVFEGLTKKKGEFIRTAKRVEPGARLLKALTAAREEGLMLFALSLAAAGVAWRLGAHHREAVLWATILAAQSIPYLAAIATSLISELTTRESRKVAAQAAAEPAPAPAIESAPRARPVVEPIREPAFHPGLAPA